MNKYLFRWILLVVLLSTSWACSQRAKYEADQASEPVTLEMDDDLSGGGPPPPPPTGSASTPEEVASAVERKIIKTGNITFETEDTQATRAHLNRMVEEMGGYIGSDQFAEYDGKVEYQLTVRVPVGKFDALLEGLAQSGNRLIGKNTYAEDVTEEFIDVEARIKTKRELENRYLELLKQAKDVEDILAIEREASTLRADIESFEGRLNFLKNQTSMATLTVVYFEQVQSNTGFGYRVSAALGNGWSHLLWFLLGVVQLWPFILLAALGLAGLRLWRRRRRVQ